MNKIITLSGLCLTLAGFAVAGSVAAPEIDASAGAAAIALLAGGLLILRSRKKR